MCAGLAVVVSDDPTVSQSVTPQVTGLLFNVGDAEDLARNLKTLIDSPTTRATLGKNAAAEIARNYTLDGTISELLRVFADVVNSKAGD